LLAKAAFLPGISQVYYFSKTDSWCVPEKYEGTIAHLIKLTKIPSVNDVSQVFEQVQ